MSEKQIRKILAQKLRLHRLAAGLTAKEVGAHIGKSEKTVSGWEHERGQPDADILFELCQLYNINSISDFYPPLSAASVTELTPDENTLLCYFRSLTLTGKNLALQTLCIFSETPEISKDK